MDVGGGLAFTDTVTGLSLDVRVRTLVVHQADGFSERGMSLSLGWDATPSSPLGLTAKGGPVVPGLVLTRHRRSVIPSAAAAFLSDAHLPDAPPVVERSLQTDYLQRNALQGADRLGAEVLNGIAWDITGTWWPKMFEVRFVDAG